nr:nephrocystin-3 isoform X1 [Tanacetum cinerariifolium]
MSDKACLSLEFGEKFVTPYAPGFLIVCHGPTLNASYRKESIRLPRDTKCTDGGSFCNTQLETFADYVGIHELEDVIGDTLQKKTKPPESWTEEDELVAFSDEPEKLFTEFESQWIRGKKNAPWWRATDLDGLVSFVSHESLQHFDNCDLPFPNINKTGLLVASSPQEPDKEMSSFSSITGSLTLQHTSGRCSQDMPFRIPYLNIKYLHDFRPTYDVFLVLLEALSHSERRAREAERAAQQAYNEKEKVISLFLKQASQMCAYKQWLYILQLETLCLQLRRHKYQPICTRFPDSVPCSHTKCKLPKRVHKATKRYEMHRSVGNFLWGLALVGAGVLLGWTLAKVTYWDGRCFSLFYRRFDLYLVAIHDGHQLYELGISGDNRWLFRAILTGSEPGRFHWIAKAVREIMEKKGRYIILAAKGRGMFDCAAFLSNHWGDICRCMARYQPHL